MKKTIRIPEPLQLLAKCFSQAGTALYAVGGLPRNGLLGLPPSDLDVCSKMSPEEAHALCKRADFNCIMKAAEFGTVEIHVGGHRIEHTTFRGEKYEPGGQHRPSKVTLGASLEADAFRRDFTCNALYMDIVKGTILDPTGGLRDVKKRVLRATSKDPRTVLQDDGLRILRLIRFACELGFDVEEETFLAAKACALGLSAISAERKRDELVKILLSDTRYPALTGGLPSPVLRGLSMLYELGALPYILPELLEGDNVRQRSRYHAFDVLRHNFHACAASEATPILRLAALLHDVGKPAALLEKGLPLDTGGEDEEYRTLLRKGETPMLGHDALGAEIARTALMRLRFPNKMVDEIVFLIENHMYDLNGRAKETTLRTRFAGYGYERSIRLCAMREADVLGSGRANAFTMATWRDTLSDMKREGAPFSLAELKCSGADVMRWRNIGPGPKVGEIMHALLLHCARYPKDNAKERLEKVARGI